MPLAQIDSQSIPLKEQLEQFQKTREYAQRRYMFFFDCLLEQYTDDRKELLNALYNNMSQFLLHQAQVIVGTKSANIEQLSYLLDICNNRIFSKMGIRMKGVVADLNVYIEFLQKNLKDLPGTDLIDANDYLEYLERLGKLLNEEAFIKKSDLNELTNKDMEKLLEIRENKADKFFVNENKNFDVNDNSNIIDPAMLQLRNKLVADFACLQKYAENLILPVKREMELLVNLYKQLYLQISIEIKSIKNNDEQNKNNALGFYKIFKSFHGYYCANRERNKQLQEVYEQHEINLKQIDGLLKQCQVLMMSEKIDSDSASLEQLAEYRDKLVELSKFGTENSQCMQEQIEMFKQESFAYGEAIYYPFYSRVDIDDANSLFLLICMQLEREKNMEQERSYDVLVDDMYTDIEQIGKLIQNVVQFINAHSQALPTKKRSANTIPENISKDSTDVLENHLYEPAVGNPVKRTRAVI